MFIHLFKYAYWVTETEQCEFMHAKRYLHVSAGICGIAAAGECGRACGRVCVGVWVCVCVWVGGCVENTHRQCI